MALHSCEMCDQFMNRLNEAIMQHVRAKSEYNLAKLRHEGPQEVHDLANSLMNAEFERELRLAEYRSHRAAFHKSVLETVAP